MSLVNTNNRNLRTYLDTGNFDQASTTRLIVYNALDSAQNATYIDRDDICIGHMGAVEQGNYSARWDPNLVNAISSNIGFFSSPISDQNNAPFFVSDFEPETTDQRLFHLLGPSAAFQELDINDPQNIIDADPFPKFTRGGPDDFGSGVIGHWEPWQSTGTFVFFPGINQAISVRCRVVVDQGGPTTVDNIVTSIAIDTGFGQPAGIPGRYADGENSFNRGPIFGETEVFWVGIQFLPDEQSTHDRPIGELFFWSQAIAATGLEGRVYVSFVDFNPTGLENQTPNRIHLRQTLLSRLVLETDTLPTGDPPVPLNGIPVVIANLQHINVFFGAAGDQRIHVLGNNSFGFGFGDTIDVQFSRGALPALISPPSNTVDPITNREVPYTCQVTGDLGEQIANATVTWSIERLSTYREVLAVTPTPGESVLLAQSPIDNGIEFPAGFGVFEDGVALVDGVDYTVTLSPAAIDFIAPKPLAGPVYTCTYAHTADPATPGHGTIVDQTVFSDIAGVAQTRVAYDDDPTLVGQLDQITNDTPT